MIPRIVEVSGQNRYLHLHRGFLVIEHDKTELGRVALDDIAALVLNGHGLAYSHNLLVALSERAIPAVVCKRNSQPGGWLWSVEGNHRQSRVMAAQLSCPKPFTKRLWQVIIKAKIRLQGDLLSNLGWSNSAVYRLERKVRSGDPENLEAQAARIYWQQLYGKDFRRDRTAAGVNTLLNYGYTIIRSACARAIMASGLHPSIGIRHKNQYNNFCLVDDLIEPFRPLIDERVFNYLLENENCLDKVAKAMLAESLFCFCELNGQRSSVQQAIISAAQSLASAMKNKNPELLLPNRFISCPEDHSDDEWLSYDVDSVNV